MVQYFNNLSQDSKTMSFTQFHLVEKMFIKIQKTIRMSDDIRGAEMTHGGAEYAAPLLAFQPRPNTATQAGAEYATPLMAF
jgi:hypothetical protein